jgi:phage shock protein PspC (stress-responsive transcriptional regulator)
MTAEKFEEKKSEVKEGIATSLNVDPSLVEVAKAEQVQARLRRMLNELELDVTVLTDDENAVTNKVSNTGFADTLSDNISQSTGETVTASGVTAAVVEVNPNAPATDETADSGGDDDTDLTWLWIVLAIVGVLACGGIAYVVINTQDGAQGEKGGVGGEEFGDEGVGETKPTKRSPGAQAMHDSL